AQGLQARLGETELEPRGAQLRLAEPALEFDRVARSGDPEIGDQLQRRVRGDELLPLPLHAGKDVMAPGRIVDGAFDEDVRPGKGDRRAELDQCRRPPRAGREGEAPGPGESWRAPGGPQAP